MFLAAGMLVGVESAVDAIFGALPITCIRTIGRGRAHCTGGKGSPIVSWVFASETGAKDAAPSSEAHSKQAEQRRERRWGSPQASLLRNPTPPVQKSQLWIGIRVCRNCWEKPNPTLSLKYRNRGWESPNIVALWETQPTLVVGPCLRFRVERCRTYATGSSPCTAASCTRCTVSTSPPRDRTENAPGWSERSWESTTRTVREKMEDERKRHEREGEEYIVAYCYCMHGNYV